MNTISKDQVVVFARQLPRLELERQYVSMVLEAMEKATYLYRYLSASTGSLRVRVLLPSDGLLIIQERDSKEFARTAIIGSNGAWLKYALLQTLEGQPPSGLAAALFSNSPNPLQRVNRMNNEVYRTVSTTFPTLNLRIRASATTTKHRLPTRDAVVSSFKVSWADDAQVSGPVFDAKAHFENASNEHSPTHMEAALTEIVSAIQACPLFFPSFALLLKCHSSRPEVVTAFCQRPDAQPILLAGALAIEKWLRDVRQGFNPATIPEYADIVQRICIQDIDARLSKVTRIMALLNGDAPATTATLVRNPLNPLLTFFRQPDQPHYSAQDIIEGEPFKSLSADTLKAVRTDDRYPNIAADFREANLLSAIVRLAEESALSWFPEPTDKTSWRDDTIRTWKNAVFSMLLAPADNPWIISLDANPGILNRIASPQHHQSNGCKEEELT